MAGKRGRKPRITGEQISEMVRLHRQGKSISAIAQATGCHRQTVRAYLRERQADILADEVRKEVLIEELRGHFQELRNFAVVDLKRRLDASPSEAPGITSPKLPIPGRISTLGMLGLPGQGSWNHVADQWIRMYYPSPKESHLMQALREHLKTSDVWVYWDGWWKDVAEYEAASRNLFQWVVDKTEPERLKKISPEHMELVQRWLFGNILLKTSGADYGGEPLYDWLGDILKEAETLPEWTVLKEATAQLREKERQNKLKDIIDKIDSALDGIELMRAFPGRCHLCPV
jgi:transposase-like protein